MQPVQQEHKELLVRQDQRVHKEIQEHKVPLVHKAQQVHKEKLEL